MRLGYEAAAYAFLADRKSVPIDPVMEALATEMV